MRPFLQRRYLAGVIIAAWIAVYSAPARAEDWVLLEFLPQSKKCVDRSSITKDERGILTRYRIRSVNQSCSEPVTMEREILVDCGQDLSSDIETFERYPNDRDPSWRLWHAARSLRTSVAWQENRWVCGLR
jgi:hypothetical protein